MKVVEKEQARALRKQGKSLNQIIKETGFSKGSVSLWVRDIVLTAPQRQQISERGRSVASIENRRISRLKNQQEKVQVILDGAKSEFAAVSVRELHLIGTMLYWGEGGKTGNIVRIANSDPGIVQVMMRFFRITCHVPEEKFRVHIHTFAHADVEKTERYWSRITNIPRKQFYKTYTKQSSASLSKRKTLPYGTVDIYICDTKLFHMIIGWIEKIKELVLSSSFQ